MATNSGIAIKGITEAVLHTYANGFNYTLIAEHSYTSYELFAQDLFKNYLEKAKQGIAWRGAYVSNDWTVIIDPELVDGLEKEKLETISRELNAEVFTFLIQTTSCAFAFAKYDKVLQRNYFSVEDDIYEDSGRPLLEEEGLNINTSIFTEDILSLANKMGIELYPINTNQDFIIKEWKNNNFKPISLAPSKAEHKSDNANPWWKKW